MSDKTVLEKDRVEAIARAWYETQNFFYDPYDTLPEEKKFRARDYAKHIIAADPATALLKECAEVMEEWKAADDYDGPLGKTVSRSIYHDAVTSRDALLERLRRIHHEV